MMRFLKFFILNVFLVNLSIAETPTEVGVVLGLTGYASVHADAILKGAQLAQETLKKDSYPLEFTIEDDQTNPGKTVSAIKFLLAKGIKFFIGPTWSFQTKAATPILERGNAIAFVPQGSSEINGRPSPAIFSLTPPRTKQIEPISKWLSSYKDKIVLIIVDQGEWGQVHAGLFKQAIDKAGAKLLAIEFLDYGSDVSTFKSILIKHARSNVSAVLSSGSSDYLANLLKARNQLKENFSFLASFDLIDAVNSNLIQPSQLDDNIFISHVEFPSAKFQHAYREKYQVSAPLYSDRGYDAVMALASALKNTDGSSSAVSKYLKSTTNIDGTIGNIQFDKNGDILTGSYKIEKAITLLKTHAKK